jgi:hypothetical protein
MTVVIYQVTDERVAVLTDTMACDLDGTPLAFIDKCEVIPHLGVAIAGNGWAGLGERFVEVLRTSPLVRDVDTVNAVAPELLGGIWEGLASCRPAGRDRTTIYVFGMSEALGVGCGFAYKSDEGFVSQPAPKGAVGITPVPSFDDYDVATLDGWVDLACRLRDDGADGRLVIGGDLMLTVLAPGSTSVSRVHRFDDEARLAERFAEAAG